MSQSTDADGPDIPQRAWENPYPDGHPLHDLFARRVKNNQDLVILIDDYHARRGTGKTVASLQLAQGMNHRGGLTWENVSMSPEEIRNCYYTLPKRSGIVFDEGEVGASKYQAMTKSSQALREIVSMGRIEEKYVVINTPAIGLMDSDLRMLADVWIMMLAKGIGLIHYFERQPYGSGGSGKLLTPKKGLIQFRDIQPNTPLREVYNKLTREKEKRIRGEEGGGFITMSEHREELEKAREDARREQRNEDIFSIYSHPEHEDAVSQRTIGESLGLTQQHIGTILKQIREDD